MQAKEIFILFIGIVLLILLFPLLNVNLAVIYKVKHIDYLAYAFLINLFLVFLLAIRMKCFLKNILSRISLHELIKIEFMTKFFYAVMPSRLHVALKAFVLNKKFGISKTEAFSVTTLEYVLDVSIVIFISLLGLLFLFQYSMDFSIYKLLIILAIFSALLIMLFKNPKNILQKIGEIATMRSRIIGKIVAFIIKIRDNWVTMVFSKHMYSVLFLSIIMWFVEAIIYALLFSAFDLYVPFITILIVLCSALFVGGISQVPAGLGVREASAVLLFSYLGYSADISLMVMLIARIIILLPILIGYFFSLRFGYEFTVTSKGLLKKLRDFSRARHLKSN